MGNDCACFCSHPKLAAPISQISKDFAKDVAERPASPLARALAKATLECMAKLNDPIVVDVKNLPADSVDTLLRALCERVLNTGPKK